MSVSNDNALMDIIKSTIALPITNNASLTANAGDLVFWDAGQTLGYGRTLAPITSDAQAGSSIGVTMTQSPINSISQSPGNTAVYPTPLYLIVNFNGVFRFYQTAGDTYNWFDPLYATTDPQTVTNTAGGKTNVLGRVYFPPSDENGNTITPPVAATAGGIIRGIIKALYPNIGIL
jgi:hypothetical protein